MPPPINLTQLRKLIAEFTSTTHATSGPLRISVAVPTLLALIDTAQAALIVGHWAEDQGGDPDEHSMDHLRQTLTPYKP